MWESKSEITGNMYMWTIFYTKVYPIKDSRDTQVRWLPLKGFWCMKQELVGCESNEGTEDR